MGYIVVFGGRSRRHGGLGSGLKGNLQPRIFAANWNEPGGFCPRSLKPPTSAPQTTEQLLQNTPLALVNIEHIAINFIAIEFLPGIRIALAPCRGAQNSVMKHSKYRGLTPCPGIFWGRKQESPAEGRAREIRASWAQPARGLRVAEQESQRVPRRSAAGCRPHPGVWSGRYGPDTARRSRRRRQWTP